MNDADDARISPRLRSHHQIDWPSTRSGTSLRGLPVASITGCEAEACTARSRPLAPSPTTSTGPSGKDSPAPKLSGVNCGI